MKAAVVGGIVLVFILFAVLALLGVYYSNYFCPNFGNSCDASPAPSPQPISAPSPEPVSAPGPSPNTPPIAYTSYPNTYARGSMILVNGSNPGGTLDFCKNLCATTANCGGFTKQDVVPNQVSVCNMSSYTDVASTNRGSLNGYTLYVKN
jgi:hypothetical protein